MVLGIGIGMGLVDWKLLAALLSRVATWIVGFAGRFLRQVRRLCSVGLVCLRQSASQPSSSLCMPTYVVSTALCQSASGAGKPGTNVHMLVVFDYEFAGLPCKAVIVLLWWVWLCCHHQRGLIVPVTWSGRCWVVAGKRDALLLWPAGSGDFLS